MPANSMTAYAATVGGVRSGRPPVVGWTLRLLLCITDTRTEAADCGRLYDRMARELAPEARTAVVDAVTVIMSEIRKAEDTAAEAAESELAL